MELRVVLPGERSRILQCVSGGVGSSHGYQHRVDVHTYALAERSEKPPEYFTTGEVERSMFETILIATGGSERTERAVEMAFDLTERFDADLHVLTVVDEESEDRTHATAQAVLDDLAARTDRTITTAVETGDPTAVICSYATRTDVDVIVTGTRGRDSPYAFHLGSVAEGLVHECPVPVLTVRQLDDDAADVAVDDSNHDLH